MGDAPLAFTETTAGVRVSENDVVSIGHNDVGALTSVPPQTANDVLRFWPSRLAVPESRHR